jgi:hypothetical protein
MLKLRQIASNMTEIQIPNGEDVKYILFSYETPVAGHMNGEPFKTSKYWSSTTTRHINKYFRDVWNVDPDTVRTIPQEQIDALVK